MRLSVAERRRLTIEAALRVIATEGVENATTRRIADEAGVPQSGLFYAFDNRDEILAAVVEYGIDQQLEALTARISVLDDLADSAAPAPEMVLRAGFEAFAGDIVGNATREYALISLGLYARRTPDLESLAKHLYTAYADLVVRMLSEGARIGGFEWAVPLTEIAPVVISLTDGLTLGYVMTGDQDAMNRTVDAAVRVLTTYVVE